jgi:hypothetical protein
MASKTSTFTSQRAYSSESASVYRHSAHSHFDQETFSKRGSSFYINVFYLGPDTDGCRFSKMRVRANAFFCQNGCNRDPPWGEACVNCAYRNVTNCPGPDCHWINPCPSPYSIQPMFALFGTNFEVVDCDLWSSWEVFMTATLTDKKDDGSWIYFNVTGFHDTSYGNIARNTIWSAGGCHWFDGTQQVIYENNECTGVGRMAGGDNIASYAGGFAHHLFLGSNLYNQDWGNDREIMTYDDAGEAYNGRWLSLTHGGRLLTTPGGNLSDSRNGGPKQNFAMNEGKAVVIGNGTGAGQYRRVVNWSWDSSAGGLAKWTLDRPFTVTPDADSYISIVTFRGENIFYRNEYVDAGAFQYYGVGINNLAIGLTAERQGGFLNFGQQIAYLLRTTSVCIENLCLKD